MEKRNQYATAVVILIMLAGGVGTGIGLFAHNQPKTGLAAAESARPALPSAEAVNPSTQAKDKTVRELVEQYRDLQLTDAHNHDASDTRYLSMLDTWKRDAVNRVVLFGDVSEPSAVRTDGNAWHAYETYPDLIIPFFSGFDLRDKISLEVVQSNLEKGFFGLGEIAAASTSSPVVSRAAWKGKDPMDGYLPQIYSICAKYKAPILLHIDPPNGTVIDKLEEALDKHPDTTIIFAHANAFNSPKNIEGLLAKHPNLYADFFAGFTALNPASNNKLEDFVPVMKRFPDRFMLSTDSGFGLKSEEAAIGAMYLLLDKLDDPVLARKIARDNLDSLIRNQPATETQKEQVREKGKQSGQSYELSRLTKAEAGKILLSK